MTRFKPWGFRFVGWDLAVQAREAKKLIRMFSEWSKE